MSARITQFLFPPANGRGGTAMEGRQRIQVALRGEAPDRVPCALNFYHVDVERMAPPGALGEDSVDVDFVRLVPAAEDEALFERARPYPPDTRLGTFEQVATYARWSYRPQSAPLHSEQAPRNPLAHARSLKDLQRFAFPGSAAPYPLAGLVAQVDALHARGWAAGGNLPHLGGELFETAWRLRGLENFLLDLVERPAWAHWLLDRLTEMACRNVRTLVEADVDLLFLDDDVGMPGTMIIGPETWRTFFKGRLTTIIEAARAVRPELPVLFHSDGCFDLILDDLVEIGINGINPLQPEHMDARHIRQRYGPKLVLWGAVGHQTTLSQATPDAIRQEVRQRIEMLGRAGLVLCPAYDVTEPDIPWANIAAFLEAARIYG
jgi:uroporphyrinogen decarboxylase